MNDLTKELRAIGASFRADHDQLWRGTPEAERNPYKPCIEERAADHIDALTAMVKRLADECESWVGYVTESVHCEAYKQAMIPVNEARALIGEDGK